MNNSEQKTEEAFAIHSVVCSACGEKIPEHEKDVILLSKMSKSDIEDLECISCEMKFRDSADLDMFGG